ncbi:AbrB family transcriptional regulator [Sporosarcina sp. G11-34]|uniref:AbrB family transcriptional regulator n=1 Tax=Sporosarcina sp. G11-34 TaxID=2849605 RepID=UPI0022A94D1D|nr:AbrB family transcriptional regulator [Sporosarcina sp. G11-34]MCZ2257602.1 AbrB family transcriptional regulator [Sporosarcina sp. G11-34]
MAFRAIVTGIVWGIFKGKLSFDGLPFKISLAFVAANIGLRLDPKVFTEIQSLLLPLLLTILITLTTGYFLSLLLYSKTDLDEMTAFFCCIPGGASEIIGMSKEFGADERIVAAFHTVRITVFVLFIPLIVGLMESTAKVAVVQKVVEMEWMHFIFFPIVVVLTLLLDKKFHIPGGTLLFSIAIAFILSSFVVDVGSSPAYLSGIGQAFIGGMVGVRFDKAVLVQLLKVGKMTIVIISIFFVVSILTSLLFHYMTLIPYSVSLIGTVPAGAAEMSTTAIALDLNPSIVASLHIVRVMLLFLLLPLLIKVFKAINRKREKVV